MKRVQAIELARTAARLNTKTTTLRLPDSAIGHVRGARHDVVDESLMIDEWVIDAIRMAAGAAEPTEEGDILRQRLELHRTRQMRPDVLTPGGQYFDFLNPETNVYTVEDVAHNLSHLCRFTGSVRQHYSVAQHAVIVSHLVPPHLAWEGLHHDDAEFMLGDVSGPLKALLPGYKVIEKRVEAAMFPRLGMAITLPPEVKYADRVALATEKRDLMPKVQPDAWAWVIDDDTGEPYMRQIGALRDDVWALTEGIEPMKQAIVPVGPEEARAMYLARHYELLALRTGQPGTQTALVDMAGGSDVA